MMKRILALVLIPVLCFTMLIGCSKDETAGTDETKAVLDYAAAFAKYDPNTVVATVNGDEITWSEYFFMLYIGLADLEYYFGEIKWSEEIMEGYGFTFEEYSKMLAKDSLVQYHTIKQQAEKDNAGLTDKQKEEIQANMQMFKETYIGPEATDGDLETYLMDNMFVTREVYDFVNDSYYLYENLFEKYVGANGEKQTDAQIAEFVEKKPYVTAKHILIKTVDDEGKDLPEEELAAAKAKIYDIFDELKGISDNKKLMETFDRLMHEHNQDDGVSVFPNGYTFTKGEMVPEFEAAALALEEYQLSDVVKTDFGYHILLRLPTTRDSVINYDYEQGGYYTVANYASQDTFAKYMSGWIAEADLQWKAEFENLNMAELFA